MPDSLVRSIRQSPGGTILPTVYPGLAEQRCHFRRGWFHLLSSGPGVGKSLFALNLAIKSPSTPSLVFSADTDMKQQAVRAASIMTDEPLSVVDDAFEVGGEAWEAYADMLEPLDDYIRFVWDSGPTLLDIGEEMHAFAMMYGEWPHLVIMDNISNCFADADEWQNLRKTGDFFKDLAHKTSAAVLALHHLDGDYDDGGSSPPITAIRGKISKIPEMVLAMYGTPHGNFIVVNILKNRAAKASAGGSFKVRLTVHYERALIQ